MVAIVVIIVPHSSIPLLTKGKVEALRFFVALDRRQ